jgi:hypothetical protein
MTFVFFIFVFRIKFINADYEIVEGFNIDGRELSEFSSFIAVGKVGVEGDDFIVTY